MALALILTGIALFLAIGIFAVARSRAPDVTMRVYLASGTLSAILLLLALGHLLFAGGVGQGLVLPLGLPWMGAHFRLDPLAAFFLAVVNLGGATASLYGLGYGRHEGAPARVLPFFPAFLAGMNLVLVADDAFAFLLAWEFMSLASWALVMAHHRDADNAHAGYVYLVMASFGTLSLLLAFGLMAGPSGGYAFEAIRSAYLPPGTSALR